MFTGSLMERAAGIWLQQKETCLSPCLCLDNPCRGQRHNKHGGLLCRDLIAIVMLTALSFLQFLQDGDGIRIPGTADPQCRGNPLNASHTRSVHVSERLG